MTHSRRAASLNEANNESKYSRERSSSRPRSWVCGQTQFDRPPHLMPRAHAGTMMPRTMADSIDSPKAATSAELAALYRGHVAAQQARVEAALAAAGCDGLVIHAGELIAPPRDDVSYPFRPEPHFAAWLPLELPGAALVLRPSHRPVLLYPRSDDFWHMPAGDPQGHWVEQFEIRVIGTSAAESRELAELGRGCATIGGQAPDDAETTRARARVLAHLDYHRAIKTAYEIACMRAASAIAARGHRRIGAAFGEGRSEFDLQALYCAATGQREPELPYPSIIALNEHAAVLHYQHADRKPPAVTRSLLIDAGAKVAGYAADVTRTWTAAASPLQPLIDAMEQLQQTLCAEARAGVDFVALDDRAHRLLADVLVEHRLASCSADKAYASGLTRVFLPHGLGHLLGVQVHDAGGRQVSPDGEIKAPPDAHPFLRLTRRLESGFVVTIEPGLYFIPSLLAKLDGDRRRHVNWVAVEALVPYGGVRIEDDVLVQTGGQANLSREAFAVCDAA
jgi:Xaa-Pro dipeptidase